MPTPNPFPLNIDEKQDTWARLQLLANVDPEYKLIADEFNKIMQALNYLYENSGTGGSGTGEVRIDYAWFYPPNESDPQVVVNGQEFRGFTSATKKHYVTGIVTDAENFDLEILTGCKIFTDEINED